ncbi:hypothetical protein BUALT_Bualt01G0137500 [Buddleja alternifolia]|uniref:Myb/SANT-like domain-containing protein n=1 Tax=Buddleja alternifolia TaxID=168488 RepID=A0AAV6YCU0_9LAMI|nr:hypothetical protein BUALT_Bualt01G0137500 [Buddleja alternifolia]
MPSARKEKLSFLKMLIVPGCLEEMRVNGHLICERAEWLRFVAVHSIEFGEFVFFRHRGRMVFDATVIVPSMSSKKYDVEPVTSSDSSDDEDDDDDDDDDSSDNSEADMDDGDNGDAGEEPEEFELTIPPSSGCDYHTPRLAALCIPAEFWRDHGLDRKCTAVLKAVRRGATAREVGLRWKNNAAANGRGTLWLKDGESIDKADILYANGWVYEHDTCFITSVVAACRNQTIANPGVRWDRDQNQIFAQLGVMAKLMKENEMVMTYLRYGDPVIAQLNYIFGPRVIDVLSDSSRSNGKALFGFGPNDTIVIENSEGGEPNKMETITRTTKNVVGRVGQVSSQGSSNDPLSRLGYATPSPLPKRTLKLDPLATREEDILAEIASSTERIMSKLIRGCMITPKVEPSSDNQKTPKKSAQRRVNRHFETNYDFSFIAHRERKLEQHYRAFTQMIACQGVEWDEACCIVRASKQQWEEWRVTIPLSRAYIYYGDDKYEALKQLYASPYAGTLTNP